MESPAPQRQIARKLYVSALVALAVPAIVFFAASAIVTAHDTAVTTGKRPSNQAGSSLPPIPKGAIVEPYDFDLALASAHCWTQPCSSLRSGHKNGAEFLVLGLVSLLPAGALLGGRRWLRWLLT